MGGSGRITFVEGVEPKPAPDETPEGKRARASKDAFLRFLEAILSGDPDAIDAATTEDFVAHELASIGLPRGRDGLKRFRERVNAAFPDERLLITHLVSEGPVVAARFEATATHAGTFLDVAPTGREIRFQVHSVVRIRDGRVAERWDLADLAQQVAVGAEQARRSREPDRR